MAKVNQKKVDDACAEARDRYMAMTPTEAKNRFAYELHGFLAAMSARGEWPLPLGIRRVVELLDIIAKNNGIL